MKPLENRKKKLEYPNEADEDYPTKEKWVSAIFNGNFLRKYYFWKNF